MRKENIYWNSHNLLSRGGTFNFAIGGRGCGKTYNAKKTRIQHFIKTGMQFIYLRRYRTELKETQTFFDDVCQEFPGYEFRTIGSKGYVRKINKEAEAQTEDENKKDRNKWKLMCYFLPLSTNGSKKSVAYPSVDFIVYDEFIIGEGCYHYLQHEVKQFLEFYNTVDRYQDRTKVLFIANAVSLYNPYFTEFNLCPRKKNTFLSAKNGLLQLELIDSSRFKKHVDSTNFGKIIKGTLYYDYAVSNIFEDDNDTFIMPKTPQARFHYGIKFDNMTFGVWVDFMQGVYYVTQKTAKDGTIYALTKSDLSIDVRMIERTHALIKTIKKLYMQGVVFFDTISTRSKFTDLMEYLNVR